MGGAAAPDLARAKDPTGPKVQRGRSKTIQTLGVKIAIFICAGLGALALGIAAHSSSAAQGSPIKLRGVLDARQVDGGQEVKVPGAAGLFTATLTGMRLTWKLTYRGLSGPALGAHIHIAKRGASHWEPVLGLCGFLADPNQPAGCMPSVHGTAVIHGGTLYSISASAVRKAILNGGAYVNIHTTKNYNWGETRGQIEVVK